MKLEHLKLADGNHLSEPQTIENSPHQRAIAGIGLVPEERFGQIKTFAGDPNLGPVEQFATHPDGRSVSQAEFMTQYARAVNLLANRAIQHLNQNPSLDVLRQRRDTIQNERLAITLRDEHSYYIDGLSQPLDLQNYPDVLTKINDLLHQQIIEIASDNEEEIELRGLDLAIMMLEQEVRKDELLGNITAGKKDIQLHADLMHQARTIAKTGEAKLHYPQAQTEHEKAFLTALDLKLETQGYIPPLITLHDIDRNIIAGSDSSLKPGNITGKLVDHLDEIAPTPARQRLQLTDYIQMHPRLAEIGTEMLRFAGFNTHPVFSDVIDAIHLAEAADAGFKIITSNMRAYGEGVVKQFQNGRAVQVFGMDHDSYASQEKRDRLMEVFLENTDAVFLISDDSDRSLVQSLNEGTILQQLDENIHLENLYFFASRVPVNGDQEDYTLSRTLAEKNIAFAANQISTEDNRVKGYQGVVRTLELYTRWKEVRLAEGWATNKAEAQAKKVVAEMVMTASQAYQEALLSSFRRQKELATSSLTVTELENLKNQAASMDTEEISDLLGSLLISQGSPEQFRELADQMLEVDILQGKYGLKPEILSRAYNLYLQWTENLPNNSPEKYLLAVKAFKQAQNDWKLQAQLKAEGFPDMKEGLVRTRMIGYEKIADINLGTLLPEELSHIWTRREITEVFDRSDVRFLMVRFTDGQDDGGQAKSHTLIIEREGNSDKLMVPGGETLFDGRGILLPGDKIPGHKQQEDLFLHHLRSFVEIAMIYYRNPFNGRAGGLETTMRKQAEILKNMGFSIRIVGGNNPDPSYGEEFLSQFKHSLIEGGHDELHEAKKVSKQLNQGLITPDFEKLRLQIREQLSNALSESDVLWVHHVLSMSRNFAFTHALVDLIRSGELLNLKRTIAVTHDVGPVKNPDHYHEGNPWNYTASRLKGITYVPVSEEIQSLLSSLPLENEVSEEEIITEGPIYAGIDVEKFEPDNRVRRAITEKLNPSETDYIFLMPMRIAENKNIHTALAALSSIPDAKLIVTGPPHRLKNNGHETVHDEYYDLLKALVKELGLEKRVLILFDEPGVGEIIDQEFDKIMPWLMKTADAVIMPSSFEGWNIASNEAGAVKTPVVLSDIPVHRENVGKHAAAYVNPSEHSINLATAMVKGVEASSQTVYRRDIRKNRNWRKRIEGVLHLFDGGGTQWVIIE